MKTFTAALISAGLILCAVNIASAQMRNAPPPLKGLWHPIVGSGAVYESVRANGTIKNTMEFDVLSKESAGGKDAIWIEVSTTTEELGKGDAIAKELVAFDDSLMQMQVFKFIMQIPGRPPMEMPQAMNRMQPIQYSDVRSTTQDLGKESITTPGGTFSCEHYRGKSDPGDAWISDTVAPFGLVKYQDKDQTVTLIKAVTDVKDKITGTPQPFNPMLMQPQR